MRKFTAVTLSSILLACAPANIGRQAHGLAAFETPLTGEELRRLLKETNTYLEPVRSGDVVIDHPPHELFRPNGTYSRRTGRFGPDGWYAIEGDRLCVTGDGIPKQCRKVIPQGGQTYLLIDVSDSSRALMRLSQHQ